ncbi:MAG: hypothetical protein KDA36_13405, partial [Planctomycetaceae bacterium]|nr:hypothetical protein [Planctomycetaceae bacterium]
MLRRVSLAQLTGEEGSATEFCCSMVSQQDGRFRIQGLLPGEYIVSIPRRVSMAKIPTIPTTDHQPFLSFDLPSEWKDPNADLIAFDPHPVTLKPHETTQLKIVAKPPATTPPPVKLQPVVDPNLLHEGLLDLRAGNPPAVSKSLPPNPQDQEVVRGEDSHSDQPKEIGDDSPHTFQKRWQIVDVAGKPIPDVQVEADDLSLQSDHDGWVSGSFSNSRKYNLTFTKPGFLPVSLHLNEGNFFRSYQNGTPLTEQTKFEMMRCSTLDVTVLDTDGKAVPNYRLSVSNRFSTDVLERNSKNFRVLTDERGRAV